MHMDQAVCHKHCVCVGGEKAAETAVALSVVMKFHSCSRSKCVTGPDIVEKHMYFIRLQLSYNHLTSKYEKKAALLTQNL